MTDKLREALEDVMKFPQTEGDNKDDIIDAMREIAKEALCGLK